MEKERSRKEKERSRKEQIEGSHSDIWISGLRSFEARLRRAADSCAAIT
jgi:sulfur transfer protein SufE